MLDKDITISNIIYLAEHQYENVDNWMLFSNTIVGNFYSILNIVSRP